MQFEVEVGGRIRRVTVTRSGAAFALTIDGRTTHVDAARIDAHTLSLLMDSARSQETVVAPDGAPGRVVVAVGGLPIPVILNGRRRGRGDAASGSPGKERQERIAAPMPGKIVRVLVKAGDAVKARQPLVVVEAMKMENELRAGRDGTVAELQAREGQSVEAGAPLVVIQ